MTAIEKERLRVKVFIGAQITPDMRLLLNKSVLWNQAKIGSSDDCLKEIHSSDKDYLGYYIQQEFVQIDFLKTLEAKIRDLIKAYCPNINADRISVQIFPQIFIE